MNVNINTTVILIIGIATLMIALLTFVLKLIELTRK